MPDGQLGARLSQVAGVEAVIDHGVVEGRADGTLHQPRLLTALPTGVWEYVAFGRRLGLWDNYSQIRARIQLCVNIHII